MAKTTKSKRPASKEPMLVSPKIFEAHLERALKRVSEDDDAFGQTLFRRQGSARIPVDDIDSPGEYELVVDDEVKARTVVSDNDDDDDRSMPPDAIAARASRDAIAAALDTMRATNIDLTRRLEKEQTRYEKLEAVNNGQQDTIEKLREQLRKAELANTDDEMAMQLIQTGGAAVVGLLSRDFVKELKKRGEPLMDSYSEEERDVIVKFCNDPRLRDFNSNPVAALMGDKPTEH